MTIPCPKLVRTTLAILVLVAAGAVGAADIGRVKIAKGAVAVDREGATFPAAVGMRLRTSDVIRTGSDGAVGITMDDDSQRYPTFQHQGTEFLYMLEGKLEYRCGQETYLLEPGDSLSFQGDIPHGPERLMKCPIKFLSMTVYPRGAE